MIEPIDQKVTDHWAVAPLVSAGMIAGYFCFGLVNRLTGREHQLHIPNGGLQVGVTASGGSPSYTLFTTRKPVNFAAFDGVGCRLTSANLGVIYGYSIVYLTLWQGSAYATDLLARIRMTGGSFMLPGGAVAHGVTILHYGSGNPSGDVPMILPPIKDEFGEERLFVPYLTIPKAGKAVLTGDILFDFDKDVITEKSERTLLYLADLLNNRTKLKVTIEGHTDSIGSDAYNLDLSRKRANAVKAWLKNKRVDGASDFITVGYGEKRPVAPNTKPDGSDNPEGRAKNRRVEILFE